MTESEFIAPLAQESTAGLIAEKLRQAIAHGELQPGAQLGEAELARRLGVSRGPLREGMQRLTQEGLLTSIPYRGLFVIDLTPDDVRDMYLAREAIERAAARRILQGDHVAAGDELLRIVTEMAATSDPNEISDVDVRFHERLVELADSTRLSRMHQTYLIETQMCVHALADSYVVHGDRVVEHHALASAIRSGDVHLTDKLLIAHMEDAVERLSSRLDHPEA
ncbi:GntR family transcriptional regulator [Mycolicibacterium chitae]|uniref:GntR family transcriptional regulator n=1 Tax=Mycolicibacterium chitae TaxID=1792 RepID=A0A3S5EHV5_MYCCI|nr:GntR family transcriptional regulator [Mycolicibacterium chitae]MCV7108359.1 GntR family transcriptional regulator [Mycolicibacterium chitae]BBZ02240.1 GntR family transcriptional regulator [Mycolicibacterium chitae]VEG44435.1 GntR family transcriptional regulator [Mycolicibacterium chitae]